MSTSGALGRYIQMAPPLVIWARCLIGSIVLLAVLRIRRIPLKLRSRKHTPVIIFGGILLGMHWITYFYALKLSNVAIGMLSMFTYPVMTTLLEPLLLKTRFTFFNLIMSILVTIGIFFLVPEFNIENDYTLGVVIGLTSAVIYSFRNILLKKQIEQYSGISLMFYQLTINAIILAPMLLFFTWSIPAEHLLALIGLGLITTAAGHTLFVISLRHFSVSAASIMSSLQPLLGIVLAYFFLHEVPAAKTIVGGALILTTVILESIRSVRA